MKRNIFTAVAMTLSLGAWAGGWNAPTLEGIVPVAGDIVYLQNTATGQFLAGSNGWNTQASISTDGLLFELVQEADADGNSCWALKNQRSDKFGKYLFAEGTEKSFIDMGSQNESYPDCNHWNFFKQEDGTYRIQIVPTCEFFCDDCYFGWMPEGINWQNDTPTTTAVYPCVYVEENPGAGVNWKFISQEAYANIPSSYYARLELYKKMGEMETRGLEIPEDVLSVYNSAESTVAQIEEATMTLSTLMLKDEVEKWGEVDITNQYVQNPNFDQNDAGWGGTIGFQWWADNSFYITSNDGEYHNEKNGSSLKYFLINKTWTNEWLHFLNNSEVKQMITLPAGRYRLECDGIAVQEANGGGGTYQEPQYVPAIGFYLFANTSLGEQRTQILTELQDKTEVELVPDKIPNHYSVEFLTAGGQVDIGVKLVDTHANWVGADNFKLFCTNIISSPSVVELAVIQSDIAGYIDNYDDAFFCEATLEAVLQFVDDCVAPIDEENVPVCIEMYEQGKALIELMKKEIAAYRRLAETIDLAQTAMDNGSFAAVGEEAVASLASYIEKASTHLGDFDVTAEGAYELVDEYYALQTKCFCDFVKANDEGMDISGLMRNPKLDNLANTWHNGNGSALLPGWEGTRPWAYDRGCIQVYNTSFDIHQDIKSVPAGVYTLTFKGYYRWGDETSTIASIGTPTENLNNTSYVYMNDVKVPLHLWSDGLAKGVDAGGLGNGQSNSGIKDADGDDLYMPNSLWFFADGHAPADSCYVNSCSVIVTEDGSMLRVGVAAEQEHNKNEAYIRSMSLRYEGTSPRAMMAAYEPVIDRIKSKIEKANTFMPLSKELYNMPEALRAEAETVIATDDMQKCSDHLIEMISKLKVIDDMLVCVGKLKESLKYYDYNLLLDESSTEFIAQFNTLQEFIKGGCTPWDTNDEMINADRDFNALFVAGVQAKGTDATLDNPYEMTIVIRTADFWDRTENETSAIYWQGVSAGSKVEEEEIEFYDVPEFNLYQVIYGLPKGFYRLSAQGFYRGGETLASNLYAQIADDVWQSPMMSIQSADDYENVINMATAQEAFTEGKYAGNTVEFCIEDESADVTVGVKKNFDYPTDWTVINRFQLFFLGQTAPDAIQSVTNTKTDGAAYNLAGQKVGAGYKGIVIKNGKKLLVR